MRTLDITQQSKDFSVPHEATIRVRATRVGEILQIIHQNIEDQWLLIQLLKSGLEMIALPLNLSKGFLQTRPSRPP